MENEAIPKCFRGAAASGYTCSQGPQAHTNASEIDLDIADKSDISKFVAACVFIVALCRSLLERIKERSSVGAQSFAITPLNMIGNA